MKYLKISNIIIEKYRIATLTKYAVLCLAIFYTNYTFSQCTDNITYSNSVDIPDLTQVAAFVNAEDVTISSTENIAFESGRYSILKPGFETEYGAVFSSKIVPCSPLTCSINNGNQILSIDRGPFLQKMITNTTEAEVIIKWRDALNVVYNVELISASGTSVFFNESDAALQKDGVYRILFLTGLNPKSMYQYKINYNDSDKEPVTGFFRTSPTVGSDIPDSDPVSFWVMGDAGYVHLNRIENMRDAYFEHTGDEVANTDSIKDCTNHFLNTDFIINLGDNAYDDGTDAELQSAVFEPYQKILKYLPLWSALGNHESDYPFIIDNSDSDYPFNTDTITGDDIHKYVFELPKVDILGIDGDNIDVNEQYYSFDYGNIHFACLYSQFQTARDSLCTKSNGESEGCGDRYDDHNKMYEEMFTWLREDLDQAEAHSKWTVIFFHKPVVSASGKEARSTTLTSVRDIEHDSSVMRDSIENITNIYDIDLVLYGHNHFYERSYLVRCGIEELNDQGFSSSPSIVTDAYGDFEILDYGCVNGNNCDNPSDYNQISENYDHSMNKVAGANNGTVFVTCGASSKNETWLKNGVYTTAQDFFNHPIMRIFTEPNTIGDITNGGRALNQESHIGSLNFSVTNNELVGAYISKDGILLDEFTIVKNAPSFRRSQSTFSVYPNPLKQQTTIEYELANETVVSIFVSDVTGKNVAMMANNENKEAGKHQLIFNAKDLPVGIYYCTIQANDHVKTKKIVITK